ncbi:hypothetical protein JX265_003058 [Neoarthrinium moseri]|uniref:protein-ribulosamine 3-kinase n=1 Tax=Neoarthrinium moseri TaxID=1658444 RepID=A0A9P9WU23_9PEZI|nr:hypothetical protein JX266_002117 [Neoarthrinium moseri]KAI1878881.1 hypothetical protein JX265_003058 [Neoarthrinium moseri]
MAAVLQKPTQLVVPSFTAGDIEADDEWNAQSSWDMKVEVPAELTGYVDANILACMPPGTIIDSIRPHGSSYWSATAEIQATLEGEPRSYFVKATQNKFGKKMFRGEYESAKAIHDACPDFCPPPIAWGTYQSVPNTYFFLSGFIDMLDDLPDLGLFPQKLAEMHMKAIAPDGMYGFHVQTMTALLPQYVTKSASWEEFFTGYMRHLMMAETFAQGPLSDELNRLETVFLERIIPRLCRPLETGGRSIEPRLLHSDLWDGNAAIEAETENPIIFDPSCFYGHNEFEIGVWRCPRHKTGKPYIENYHRYFAKSNPEEDYDGRNLMYLLSFETRASACWVGRGMFRESMICLLKELEQKFPESYEEWAKARGESVCERKASTPPS